MEVHKLIDVIFHVLAKEARGRKGVGEKHSLRGLVLRSPAAYPQTNGLYSQSIQAFAPIAYEVDILHFVM